MKTAIPLLAILSVFFGQTFAAEKPKIAEKPNIIVIFTDDHGWADLGAQGVDPDIRTPHTDQLARDGVRFTRGYVTGPQCVPSRAGLIAGRHQNRFGVDDNLKGPLPLDVVTLPERLQRAGYVTGMSGKWHLDLSKPKDGGGVQRVDPRYLPHAHGFDEYWCGTMRQYHASHALDGTPFPDAPRLVGDARFRITVQTEAALSFLERRTKNPDQPWFLYLPWFAPHVPLESPEPWFSRTPAHLPLERRQALAMIAAMDDGVGRIRTKLREMGQERNTLIFYIADNGAPLRPGAWNGSINAPLIGEKGMLTDGGVRVPFVAAWPGTLPAGQVYDHPVSSLDVAATAVALAGLPHDDELDGVNLMPFLTGRNNAPPHDNLFWRWRSQAAVLEFPWKLIRLGRSEHYLFDVTQSDGETKNLIANHPEIAARLQTKLDAWCATLATPGAPEALNAQDLYFYSTHVDKTLREKVLGEANLAAGASGVPNRGWIARQGILTEKGGVLTVTRAGDGSAKSPLFLARSGLKIAGPAIARITLKSDVGGTAAIAWRTEGDQDFPPANRVTFEIEASDDWQTREIRIPAAGTMIHLRLFLPSDVAQIRDILFEPEAKSAAPTR